MKMIKVVKIVIFAVAALMVLVTVSHAIIQAEITRAKGDIFRFAVSGFDPHDVFRGRYLAIRMENRLRNEENYLDHHIKGRAYGILAVDENGIAYVDELRSELPLGKPYLAVRAQRYGRGYFEPPFERYYMNEKLAPEAERVLSEALRREDVQATLVLKIHNGFAVVEDLEVGGTSIHELLDTAK